MPEIYNYMVKRTLMTPVEERMFCPCGEEMKATSGRRGIDPEPRWLHKCKNGHEHELPPGIKYPRVVHVLAKNADKIKTSVYYN